MRRDQSKTPEPMRGTLPNTDQQRIPHSEYPSHLSAVNQVFSRVLPFVAHKFNPVVLRALVTAVPHQNTRMKGGNIPRFSMYVPIPIFFLHLSALSARPPITAILLLHARQRAFRIKVGLGLSTKTAQQHASATTTVNQPFHVVQSVQGNK